jgi:hypothetical protein
MESGDALTPINFATSAGDFATTSTAPFDLNVSGNPNRSHWDHSFVQFFNTAAFTAPPNGARGNAGPGIIRGPGQNNWDLSVAKNLQISRATQY